MSDDTTDNSKDNSEDNSKKSNILTIWANDKTQQLFKESWKNFNKTIVGTVTQEEYLNIIINNHKDKVQY